MQQREKILAGFLAVVVGLWFGMPMVQNMFLQPLQDLEDDESSLYDAVETKTQARLQLARADAELKDWRLRSLPPDPLVAQGLYQEWLVDLAQISGFSGTNVTIDKTSREQDIYVKIPVTLKTKATLQELAQFLERFHSVDLMHRIAACHADSPASEGNPELDLTITAEGIAIQSAPARSRLFPETGIDGTLGKEDKTFRVYSTEGFPEQTPFLVRVNEEFMNVTAANGEEWTVQRGVAKSFAEDHGENPEVELFPIRQDRKNVEEETQQMWSVSLFTKPAPKIEYDPKLASTEPPPVVQGRIWEWKMEVDSWDPANGAPLFQLLNAPEGVDVVERTGELRWESTAEAPLGEHLVEAVVWGDGNRNAGFTSSFALVVREQNRPPVIEPVANARFFLGRDSTLQIQAADPDNESERLTFGLEGAPEGMTINPSTGELRWQPPDTLEPQNMTVSVTATDADEFAETATLQLPFSLEEDSARFAYLTACFEREVEPIPGAEATEPTIDRWAWIHDRATNQLTVVHQGESVKIADFDMVIEEIGEDFIVVKREDSRYRLDFEQSLVQMRELPQPVAAPYSPEPGAGPPESATSAEPETAPDAQS